ncbi:GntR family transcriptional regulator [Brevibacterium marinum]|uniref:DNA-binding GntR family transcriptional regulator n=1 Tax=Brevibacterium marinum TaxID=418643 RepID=A0A846RR45_9MICO|nr:GntR family transcriptional regulator [Brevibacterium marinum]NJC56464.1 DNA-binding GntR family transcriptional regulator [Brevibacterium marinum]
MSIVNRGPTLTQQTTDRLRQAIVAGELPTGSLHSATALGEWLGVSRTPVREATAELARLGLVSIEPNRGIRILETDIESLIDGFELRMIIEVPLARKAALNPDRDARKNLDAQYADFKIAADTDDPEATLRADRDFHSAVLAMAGNTRAADVLHEQRNMVLQTGVGTVPTSRSCQECFADHVDIFDAIMAQHPEAAAAAMRRHIYNTAETLINQETRRRPEFGEHDLRARLAWISD